MWYSAKEISIILGTSIGDAYKRVRALGLELENKGYAKPPAGKIQKKWFCERYMLSIEECEEALKNEREKQNDCIRMEQKRSNGNNSEVRECTA